LHWSSFFTKAKPSADSYSYLDGFKLADAAKYGAAALPMASGPDLPTKIFVDNY
jgi:hypothetical protein